ncbi:MAG: glycosyltransferase family 4 protein [Deltaproteobacteria bacterium]|nr:glycosyltransferase family 4 protein [Deltaproteobacteria bacterium]MBW2305983.1 glycosyltransferase family 4 protein [Deltaproteobacteria bacterium]
MLDHGWNGYNLNKIAVIGTHLPRNCGIASFTSDLSGKLEEELGETGRLLILAVNDVPEGYTYPDRVRFELQVNDLADYQMAADFLTINRVNVVFLQHEFGIYGGPAGHYILTLLESLRMPVITTLHTILTEPDKYQRTVMEGLLKASDRLVVMSCRAKEMLISTYGAEESKIVFIPHGIPDIPFVDSNYYKDRFGIEGRKVILTFGLLSPGKGIEVMLEAMPRVVEKNPDAVYIVLGATHPQVLRERGPEYRQMLQRLVMDHGLQENVIFHDRFVSLEELIQYICAADIYVTPYLNPAQITSGTLAYALGMGKAVVSTPYWYAEEMLADNRGCLVPFRDAYALAERINYLFDNETKRHAMRKRAYLYCRNMVWKRVAEDYLKLAGEVIKERSLKPRPMFSIAAGAQLKDDLPPLDLRHLRIMTDSTGIIQHAIYATPDRRYGYCTDDNARALIATVLHWKLFQDESLFPLMQAYLAFLASAFNPDTRRFRNFMSYERRWLEEVGSEDSHSRAVWALGLAVAVKPTGAILNMAVRLFDESLPPAVDFGFPRSWAFTLIGLHAYLERFSGDAKARRIRETLARRLFHLFLNNGSDEWPWLEDTVTYANGVLPHALLLSGQWIPDGRMVEWGLRSLKWLLEIQTNEEGHISLIGNNGWFRRNGDKARFDQQPLEIMHLVNACGEAYHVTGDTQWLTKARHCMDWFFGKNDLLMPLYNSTTGGCCDGLTPQGPNQNQGAESTLACLLSLLTLKSLTTVLAHDDMATQEVFEIGTHSNDFQLPSPTLWHRDVL